MLRKLHPPAVCDKPAQTPGALPGATRLPQSRAPAVVYAASPAAVTWPSDRKLPARYTRSRHSRCCLWSRSGLVLEGLQRAGERDQVGARLAVFRNARQRVHHAVLAHGNGVDVQGPLAVLVKDGAIVGVFVRLDIVGDQVQVFEPLGFTHRRLGLAGETFAVHVNGAASQVMDGFSVRAERKAEVAVAELVEHATTLGRLRGDAFEHFDAVGLRVEAEEVARVAVDTVDLFVTRAPEGLPPVRSITEH